MHEVSCSFSHNLLVDAMAALQQSWMNPGKPPLTVRAHKITMSLLAASWKKWHILAANTTDQRATAGYLKPDWSWLISIIFSKPPPCQSQTFPDQRCGQAANQEPCKVQFWPPPGNSPFWWFAQVTKVSKRNIAKRKCMDHDHHHSVSFDVVNWMKRIVSCLYIIGCVSSPKTNRSRWISWFLPKYFDVVHRTLLAAERPNTAQHASGAIVPYGRRAQVIQYQRSLCWQKQKHILRQTRLKCI